MRTNFYCMKCGKECWHSLMYPITSLVLGVLIGIVIGKFIF